MSETLKIGSALSFVRGIMFGTKSSDATLGETVDVTSGAAHVKVAYGAGSDSVRDAQRTRPSGDRYQTLAASQASTLFGSVGAVGDLLSEILVIPATTSPGAITIKDSSGGGAITVFTGGTVSDLKPFVIPINKVSLAGGWYVSTGANVSLLIGGTPT